MVAGMAVGGTAARLTMTCVLTAAVVLLFVPTALAAPPANDDFADAQPLSGLPVTANGSNVGATQEPEEPTHGFAGHSVWYSWQAPGTAVVTIGTCGSDYNAALAVYTGSALNALALVESNVFSFGPNCSYGYRGEVTFKATAGTTYVIEVDGADVEFESKEQEEAFPPIVPEGDIELTIAATPPPANDDFGDAQPLSVGSGTATETVHGGNWGATTEAGEPDHAGVPGGASIWYSWTAPHGGTAHLTGCAGLLAAYTGATVSALTPVASAQSDGGPCPAVSFPVVAGTRYRIALDNAFDAAKGYVPMTSTYLIFSLPPENDDFVDAKVLPSSTQLDYSERTVGASKEPGEPDHAGNGGGSSVWFSWTAPETGIVRLDTCASSFDTLLAAYTGGSLSALTQVASNDNANGSSCSGTQRSELSFGATAGVTYRFAVDGRDGMFGKLRLRLAESPPLQATAPVPPFTVIRDRRVNAAKRSATFTFTAFAPSAPATMFVCRLDRRAPRRCTSPKTYRNLRPGRHRFSVRAIDTSGAADPSPAVGRFRIPRGSHRTHSHKRRPAS